MKYKISYKNKLHIPLINIAFNIFQLFFVFLTFNKEFVFWGFDLRYIGFFLAAFLILTYILNHKGKVCVQKLEQKFYLLYTLILISNLSWLWNGIFLSSRYQERQVNLIILNLYNFLSFMVFSLYRDKIDYSTIYKLILFSVTVMSISIFWQAQGKLLPEPFTGQVRKTEAMGNFSSLGSFVERDGLRRYGGYAEDPNYATLFAFVGVATALHYYKKNLLKGMCFVSLFLLSAILSFSRTIYIGAIISLVLLTICKLLPKTKKLAYRVFVYALPAVSFLFPVVEIFGSMATMTIRYSMWGAANRLFLQSPVLGNGLGSFRAFFSMQSWGWYVQCHSTWWQILSEHGIITVCVLGEILVYCLFRHKGWYQRFVLLLLSVFFLTYETLYLQIFILLLYVVQKERSNIENGKLYE